MMKERDQLHKIANNTKTEASWKAYRTKRNGVNYSITGAKKECFNKKFPEKIFTCRMWDTVNELTGFRRHKGSGISKLVRDDEILLDRMKLQMP